MAGRPKKIQEDEITQEVKQPTPQPQKVAPVITERAQPKIQQVQRVSINSKKWYLVNKSTGTKTEMSQHTANQTASKYPTQFAAVYE